MIKFPAFTVLASILVTGCGFQTYSAKPVDPTRNAASYQAHDVNGSGFNDYLISQGYTKDQLPIKEWSLGELTLSAFYFHPDLEVARAQFSLTEAKVITAGQRANPGINGFTEHHSEHDSGISPWTYFLSIDIPVETGGKRQARIDQAVSLSEATRIEIAQTAWQIRSRLANSWIDYQISLQQTRLLQQEIDLRGEIVAMLEARLAVGLISNIEASNARLQLQKVQQALGAEKARTPELRAALASNAGLPATAFAALKLKDVSILAITQMQLDNGDIQQTALLNRLDIRAGLARYEAAEARLRLEIAKQYPDITLSPGYSFDQGDRIWSLGLSTLLALLDGDKNEGLIAEARALREVEGAQFEALQARVIGELEQSEARYHATLTELEKAKTLQNAQLAHIQKIEHQFDSGATDRLELTTAKLENLAYIERALSAEQKVLRAAQALEDAAQRPLFDDTVLPIDIEQSVSIRLKDPRYEP